MRGGRGKGGKVGELKWWEGDKHEILDTDNPEINDFVYASELFKRIKKGSR